MKSFVSWIFVLVFSFSSCKKEYSCNCELFESSSVLVNGVEYYSEFTTTTESTIKSTKNKAKDKCEQYNKDENDDNGNVLRVTCRMN
jgi:hypothetical protein